MTLGRTRAGRLGLLAALLACSPLLACGKGGHAPPAPSATVEQPGGGGAHAPAPPESSAPLTRARADAYARAINLTAADLPGFGPTPPSKEVETHAERSAETQFLHCAGGLEAGGALRERRSQEYARRGSPLAESVGSAVGFARTPALASAELAALRSRRTRTCLSHYLDLLFRGRRFGEGAVGAISVVQGSPPAPGTSGGFGWRMTAIITVRAVRLPIYLDILGFIYGRAGVRLLSTSLLRPFPAGAEERLFTLLLERARSHTL
jgi:hypothetical protein